jgi:hypothetical protein
VGGNTRFGDIDKFSTGRQVPLGGITLSCSMAACLPAATGAPAHPPFLHLQCSPVDKIRLPSPEFQICESGIPVVSVRVSALLFYSLFYTDEGAIKRKRASEMREKERSVQRVLTASINTYALVIQTTTGPDNVVRAREYTNI